MLNIQEKYKPIDGYKYYFITENGNVYVDRPAESGVGWQGVRELKKRGINNPNRYLQVILSNDKGKKYAQIHRLVASAFVDGYFDGAVVNHKNGDIHDNRAENLEWVTQKENIHKSYESSGINQVRNYKIFDLFDPHGTHIGTFTGRNETVRFVVSSGFNASPSSLIRWGVSRGYKLIEQ